MMTDQLPLAAPGSLSQEAADALAIWVTLQTERGRAMAMAYGGRVKRSALVDMLMDTMVTAFAAGNRLPVSAYQRACAEIVSPNAVRNKLLELEAAGVLGFLRPADNRRVRLVVPTVQTIEFYNLTAPALRVQATALLVGGGTGVQIPFV